MCEVQRKSAVARFGFEIAKVNVLPDDFLNQSGFGEHCDLLAEQVRQKMIPLEIENELIRDEFFACDEIREVLVMSVVQVEDLHFVAEDDSLERGVKSSLSITFELRVRNDLTPVD